MINKIYFEQGIKYISWFYSLKLLKYDEIIYNFFEIKIRDHQCFFYQLIPYEEADLNKKSIENFIFFVTADDKKIMILRLSKEQFFEKLSKKDKSEYMWLIND